MPSWETIANLYSSARYSECINACQLALQISPYEVHALKYAGKSLLALGQIEKAQDFLFKAKLLDMEDPEIVKDIGNCLLAAGKPEEAASVYQQALAIDPIYTPALNNLGAIAQQSCRYDDALQLFLKASALDSSLISALLGAAQCAIVLESWDIAITCCDKLLRLNNEQSGVNLLRGIAHQNKGEFNEALIAFENECATNPSAVDACLKAGAIHWQLGNLKDSSRILEQCLRLQPDCIEARLTIAQVYQKLGNWHEAIKHYEVAERTANVVAIVPFNLGVCLLELSRNQDAFHAFTRAVRLDPSLSPAWGNIGILLKNNGDFHNALYAFERVLSIDANSILALEGIADIKRQEGKAQQAIEVLTKVVNLNPNDFRNYANLGYLLAEIGLFSQAVLACEKSIAINPNFADAYANLGAALKPLNKTIQSLAATAKAIELEPDHVDAHLNLAAILLAQGDYNQALSASYKAVEINPENARAQIMAGIIRRSLGDLDGADEAFRKLLQMKGEMPEALYHLSKNIGSQEEATWLIGQSARIDIDLLLPRDVQMVHYALANCYHRIASYGASADHLQKANAVKLSIFPSDAEQRIQRISELRLNHNLFPCCPRQGGEKRIFIIGMPRSGSTLLESVLSMNPDILDLGETPAMPMAIAQAKLSLDSKESQPLEELYLGNLRLVSSAYRYTVDKYLYNYEFAGVIASYLPCAKIVHCIRHPMDNILSMFRANLSEGNNYTSSLVDTARLLVAKEKAVREYSQQYKGQIYNFNYDSFVNAPEAVLRLLLDWLDLKWSTHYLHPEENLRPINTASVVQARKPINAGSVNGWIKYRSLLEPAEKIVRESGLYPPDLFK